MKKIWYLLKCPEGDETDYMQKCLELVNSEKMEEIVCFQYQRMMRYGGSWHLESRTVLPGYVFLTGSNVMELERNWQEDGEMKQNISLTPCETPYLKDLCQDGLLIEISRGVIKNGVPIIISGPLKGRERLIRRIDRHKRTAEIEIPFNGAKKQVTVGLEIYEKG